MEYGQLVMRVSIAVPGEFRIWHGDTPDEPPQQREGFYVETVGSTAVFTPTFAPAR